jgi:hypothetical protein
MTTTQTIRIAGQRVKLTTRNGKVTAKPAPVLEWELQAEAVRRLKAMPEYASDAAKVAPGTFTLAADFNAGKRDAVKASATGVMAGEPDLRIYGSGGRLLMIEYKNADGRLSVDRVRKGKKVVGQVSRHALLRALGYRIEVIKANTPTECADATVALVRGWLAANDVCSEKNCDAHEDAA